MAAKEYITFSDITNRHIKTFPQTEVQPYIDEANNEIEDLALNLGLLIEDIVDPIPQIVKRYLLHYVTERLAEDAIGSNEIEVPEFDLYRQLFELSQQRSQELRPKITYWILNGDAENNTELRSVSFGKFTRVG